MRVKWRANTNLSLAHQNYHNNIIIRRSLVPHVSHAWVGVDRLNRRAKNAENVYVDGFVLTCSSGKECVEQFVQFLRAISQANL